MRLETYTYDNVLCLLFGVVVKVFVSVAVCVCGAVAVQQFARVRVAVHVCGGGSAHWRWVACVSALCCGSACVIVRSGSGWLVAVR